MEEKLSNVYEIELTDKKVILVGTAHVSKKSAEDAEEIIKKEDPDFIGIELDDKRYELITEEKERTFDIGEFFRILLEGKLFDFIFTSILSLPQNRLAQKFNIKPGSEMLRGIQLSKELDKKLLLLDRDVSVTISRLMNAIPFWVMPLIGISAFVSLIAIEFFIKEEDIEKLRSDDELEKAMENLSKTFPKIKEVMIDERDKIIASNILKADGKKIVAIVGAGHIKGVTKYLKEGVEGFDFDEMNKIQPYNPFKI